MGKVRQTLHTACSLVLPEGVMFVDHEGQYESESGCAKQSDLDRDQFA